MAAATSWFARLRASITLKLLFWCIALIAIFYITTVYLFINTRAIVESSSDIVDVHFVVDTTAKRMIERLISLEENMKIYEILQNEDYNELILQNLKDFRAQLSRILENFPETGEPWVTLADEFNSMARQSTTSGELTISYAMVNRWLDLLTRTRQANQNVMEATLMEMRERGRRAVNMGLIGLLLSVILGLAGSLLIAARLNRSLRELRRGIRELSRAQDPAPLRVQSNDELGELARAFNSMAQRLKREEDMRSDFISMLSHEVRTPLTSIRESVDMVADGVFGQLNDQQQEFLDLARHEAVRLTHLLRRLMQASSLEKGRIAVEPGPTQAQDLMEAARQRLLGAAMAKQIRLQVDASVELPLVMADFEHVQQVLANLLNNAIKFSPPGSQVVLNAHSQIEHSRLVFCVTDQGPGIAEEDKPFVFQKYFRAAHARQTVDGAGLGLSISKSIVEAHGGDMWLDNAPGDETRGKAQGARFCFTLPLADSLE